MTTRYLLPALLSMILAAGAPVAARAEEDPGLSAEEAPKPKKKPAKKKKGFDYEKSKYKSRELSENMVNTYKFNDKGEPVKDKKKSVEPKKKKKRSEPPEQAIREKAEACEADVEACGDKKPSEADAL